MGKKGRVSQLASILWPVGSGLGAGAWVASFHTTDTIRKVEVSQLTYKDQHFKETRRTGGKVLEGRLPGDPIAILDLHLLSIYYLVTSCAL